MPLKSSLGGTRPKVPRLGKKDDQHTRSRAQEDRVAKTTDGRRQPGSGAFAGLKGDVKAEDFLIECKRTDGKSIRLTKQWLEKISKEALEAGKHPAMVITIGTIETFDEDWLIIPLRLVDSFTKEDPSE